MSRALLLGGLLLAAPAGAQTLTQPIDLQLAPVGNVGFSLHDRRPQEDRESRQERVFNLWIVAPGDALLRPAPAEALRVWLQRKLAAELQGREIVLDVLRAEVELQDTTIDFRGTSVQGAGAGGNLIANLIAMAIIDGMGSGRTDNIFRFRAMGSVAGVPFRAELSRRYRGAGFGKDFVESFTAGLDEAADSIRASAAGFPSR